MPIDELEVYVTPDGFGRAVIVRRSDGLLRIYVHWKLSPEIIAKASIQTPPGYSTNWMRDETCSSKLYEDVEPEVGVYGTVEDARTQVRSLRGFSGASLKYSKDDPAHPA